MSNYEGYGWIKVRRHTDDPSLSWEERYRRLERHHEAETTFLINKVRDIGNPTEIETLVATTSHPAGFQVGMFGGAISTYRLEDGRYVVDIEGAPGKIEQQHIFDNPEEAAQFFTTTRRKAELGFDYEGF
jgi:hypothetical protein